MRKENAMINTELEKEAKEKLQDFIELTHSLIHHLVYEGFDVNGRPFFFEDLIIEIREAGDEFEKDFEVDQALKQIQETAPQKLQKSGLYGKQLHLKLSVVKKWKERFSRRRVKRILLELLDAVDTVLDSLLAVTGIDQALKEIKDILRNAID
jgi:hypothetical protein